MESPLVVNQYPKFSKEQILDIFKAAVPKNEFLLTLADFLPDIFSSDIVEPENFQQQPPDFNIADAILENIATPKPMRMVAQKRVYIPKAPFSSSGYADEPTHRVWYYLDEGHNIQGPFTSLEMDFWFDSGFFFNELLIRIKENNDFVKLVHLFGKTEIIQVAKPALLTPMGGHMLIDQAPLSAGILTAEPMSSGKGPALEKKQSIYTFGFDPDDNLLKDGENTQETSAETPIKLKNENEEETKSVEADEVKQPSICVNNTDLAEKEGEKDKEEKCKEIKDNKEAQEEANGQAKRSESNGQNNRHFLDVKQKEEKNLLSPSGYKKNQRGPESSKKKNSYVEVYEPKTSPCPDKSAKQQQDNRKNKGREQGQTMLQYVVKGEKKEEPEPVKEKREKNNNNNNKGGNSNNNHAKKSKQDLNDRDNIAGTPGKKNQDMVIFVPKKKAEVTYTEKAKDTPEKIYVPKQQQQYQPKEVNAVNVLPNLQPGFFQRKESDTFEVLKATSEYYQTGTTNSFPGQEASRQSLPPGLQPESGLEPAINGRNFMKKPKDRLRLVAHHQCDDYEKEQDRVVATSLGLLDLEEEAVVNKKPPVKSHFKTNSATPSPLIIDNQTVGKLYNFNEDLKYSSFSNQAENFPEKEC